MTSVSWSRFDAHILALGLIREPVAVALAAAVVEAGATAVVRVVEPLDGVVGARTLLIRQGAGRLFINRSISTTSKVLAL